MTSQVLPGQWDDAPLTQECRPPHRHRQLLPMQPLSPQGTHTMSNETSHGGTAELSALPDEPYVAGMCHDHEVHAVPREWAQHAIDQQMDGPVAAAAVCGGLTTIMLAMSSLSEWRSTRLCGHCGWAIAIETGTIDQRLDALTPTGRTRATLTRLTGDPLVARRLFEAVIARASGPDAEYELGHGATIQILATITRHAPVLGLPEECAEDSCDHRHADPAAQAPDMTLDTSRECDYPVASAVCPACTLRAGGWAGEWEGQFMGECYIHAPCGVLAALAAHYKVKIRHADPSGITGEST
jgi:hypothetical protein